jgi:S1-C subfamily serine protease
MSLSRARNGVVVSDVDDQSNAAIVGFQKGDVILEVNGEKVASTKDLARLSTASDHGYWRLRLDRGGHVMDTEIGG